MRKICVAILLVPALAWAQPRSADDWFKEGDYLLYSTTADFLPLANGVGRWVPPSYLALGDAMRSFPSASTARADGAIREERQRNAARRSSFFMSDGDG